MTLGTDEEDKRAIGTYAKEWLEETAGNILGILPNAEILLAEPVEDHRKAELRIKSKRYLWNVAMLVRTKIGHVLTRYETNSKHSVLL